MKDRDTGFALIFIMVLMALFIAQFAAYVEGTRVLWGWQWWGALLLFPVIAFFRELGALILALIGFFGAKDGWYWQWWQALMLVAPFLALTFFVLVVQTGASLIQAVIRDRPLDV